MRRSLVLFSSAIPALALAAALSACGGASHPATGAATPAATPAATQVSAQVSARTAAPEVTKVIVFMVENHSLDQMRAGMPRTYAFAAKHAYATDYTAIRHPSLPNYIAIAAGSTRGVADDADPAAHPLRGNNVFRQAHRHGKTAKVYADAMPGHCALTNHGTYAVRHNPWAYFVTDRAACRKHDVPATRLAHDAAAGRLPNVGFVIPDVIHDAHDGTLAQADAWISKRIATLTAGPDWRSGRLAIVVTADEDDYSSNNTVLTVVATRHQRPRVVSSPLSHYSLTGFLDDVIGAKHLRHARTAPSLARAFGITVG
jgi:phosphatidylinositol-3-phosphatase